MYVNFKRWSATWNSETQAFSLACDGLGVVAQNIRLEAVAPLGAPPLLPEDYQCAASQEERTLCLLYTDRKNQHRDLAVRLILTDGDPRIELSGDGSGDIVFGGQLLPGNAAERMAVRLDGKDDVLRAAVGPAALPGCDTVFAAELDAALSLRTLGEARLRFDAKSQCFVFSYCTQRHDYSKSLSFHVTERFFQDGMRLDYKPLGPAAKRPVPVGWMSWYAVQFRAGEKTILENAEAQRKLLAPFGADTVWVDWEWCHRDHDGQERPGTDMFHPDPEAYPHGLGFLADQIKAQGFTPALWIGPTCDCTENELLKRHPDMLLLHKPFWSGQYFLDPSHPAFLGEALPRMLEQTRQWGYQALKWDVMPDTVHFLDALHDQLWDASLSSRQIMKNAYAKARDMLGPDFYMLFCSGNGKREEDLAVGSFDAMRIGGDIFGWEEFVRGCIDRVYDTYLLHRTAILCDPDNVIVREQFNTLDQAVTRATLVSLLGLPFTLGDDLTVLPPERMEILQKCIPPLPARPVELRRMQRLSALGLIHVRVEKSFLAYDLADFYNLSAKEEVYRFDPSAALQADCVPLHAYDYWRDEYLGLWEGPTALTLRPYESRVIALHPVAAHPQLLSTSRHVSQGAQELTQLLWREEAACLEGRSQLPAGLDYAVVVAAPAGWRPRAAAETLASQVWRFRFRTEAAGEFAWSIPFEKE